LFEWIIERVASVRPSFATTLSKICSFVAMPPSDSMASNIAVNNTVEDGREEAVM
jgi:hypothetical protein